MRKLAAAMLASLACVAALGGCGDSELSRGSSGAGIGAGAGAAFCAVTIIGIVPCAIAGGALGAAAGASTAGPDEPSPAATAAAEPPATPSRTDLSAADTPVPLDPVATPQPRERVTAQPLR